jgi:hypothetical protein
MGGIMKTYAHRLRSAKAIRLYGFILSHPENPDSDKKEISEVINLYRASMG